MKPKEWSDHREAETGSLDERYGQAHPVRTVAGGKLAKITGCTEIMVNSLHGQGIDRLGAGLVPEAYAQDGLIEAVSILGAKSFALAVQWHPEWNVLSNKPYLAIFQAFGEACRSRAAQRNGGAESKRTHGEHKCLNAKLFIQGDAGYARYLGYWLDTGGGVGDQAVFANHNRLSPSI